MSGGGIGGFRADTPGGMRVLGLGSHCTSASLALIGSVIYARNTDPSTGMNHRSCFPGSLQTILNTYVW